MLDDDRCRVTAAEVQSTDDGLTAGSAINESGGEVAPHEWAGNETPTQLFEDEDGVGIAQPDSGLLFRQTQRENAHVGEFTPEGAIDALRLFQIGKTLVGNLAVAEAPNAIAQRLLVLSRLKIHVVSSSVLRAGKGAES